VALSSRGEIYPCRQMPIRVDKLKHLLERVLPVTWCKDSVCPLCTRFGPDKILANRFYSPRERFSVALYLSFFPSQHPSSLLFRCHCHHKIFYHDCNLVVHVIFSACCLRVGRARTRQAALFSDTAEKCKRSLSPMRIGSTGFIHDARGWPHRETGRVAFGCLLFKCKSKLMFVTRGFGKNGTVEMLQAWARHLDARGAACTSSAAQRPVAALPLCSHSLRPGARYSGQDPLPYKCLPPCMQERAELLAEAPLRGRI